MLRPGAVQLRLGREEEGWKLVEEVHEADGYNVTAYNLMNLHDHLKTFETIEDGPARNSQFTVNAQQVSLNDDDEELLE